MAALVARQRLELLSEATDVLSASFEVADTLQRLARLVVRDIADYCSVEILDADHLEELAVAHRDPVKEGELRELRRRWPPHAGKHPFYEVVASGLPARFGRADEALLRRIAQDDEHLAVMRRLACHSMVLAPLRTAGSIVGLMTFARDTRRFTGDEMDFLEEFTQRAAAAVDNARAYRAERRARVEAEESAERLARLQDSTSELYQKELRLIARFRLLARAGDILSSTLDYEATLQNIARFTVPELCDMCFLDVVEGNDTRRVYHALPEAEEAARQESDAGAPSWRSSIRPGALPGGRAVFHPELGASFWEAVAAGPEQLARLRTLGICSLVSVPLMARDHVLGALTLCFSTSGRCYQQDDLDMAEELGRRAATAIENTRLHRASREAIVRAEEAVRLSEQANRAKDEFLGIVSHELRTPLNAILGWSQLLRGEKLPDAAVIAKGLTVIERNSRAQVKLIEDILDVSRIISGKLRLELRPLELENVVRAAVEVIRPAADAKGVLLHVDEGAGATVLGDPDRLQQVVWNLLSNAVKFTPAGGRVHVRIERAGRSARLTVIDSGKGIPAEFLPYVFERFRQADTSTTRRHGGLGLGLAIVRHVAEIHGGSVRAESEGPDRGSSFTVKLPLHEGSDHSWREPGIRAMRDTDPGAIVRLDGLRVLIVDDEPDARDMLATMLSSAGAEVSLAVSASDALGRLSGIAPDVLISDVGMPGDDGYALIRTVRDGGSRFERVPALALTAYASPEDSRRATLAGFNAHLSKPVEPAMLTAVVATLGAKGMRGEI